MARKLGMPSAMKQQQRGPNKDWANSSNRINMGAPVMMKVNLTSSLKQTTRGGCAERAVVYALLLIRLLFRCDPSSSAAAAVRV